MKKYFLAICILFACMSVQAQTVRDTVYALIVAVDTTTSGGVLVSPRPFTFFGYVKRESFDIDGEPSPYKTVKHYLDPDGLDVLGAPLLFIQYFIIDRP